MECFTYFETHYYEGEEWNFWGYDNSAQFFVGKSLDKEFGEELQHKVLSLFIKDFRIFKKLIEKLNNYNIQTGIASFGSKELIKSFLFAIFGKNREKYFKDTYIITSESFNDKIFKKNLIKRYPSNTKKIEDKIFTPFTAFPDKNTMLDIVLENTKFNKNEILLIDDDKKNIIKCKKDSYSGAWIENKKSNLPGINTATLEEISNTFEQNLNLESTILQTTYDILLRKNIINYNNNKKNYYKLTKSYMFSLI